MRLVERETSTKHLCNFIGIYIGVAFALGYLYNRQLSLKDRDRNETTVVIRLI